MDTNTIVYCVFALLLGMILSNMIKNVCGCKVVEGYNQEVLTNFTDQEKNDLWVELRDDGLVDMQCSNKFGLQELSQNDYLDNYCFNNGSPVSSDPTIDPNPLGYTRERCCSKDYETRKDCFPTGDLNWGYEECCAVPPPPEQLVSQICTFAFTSPQDHPVWTQEQCESNLPQDYYGDTGEVSTNNCDLLSKIPIYGCDECSNSLGVHPDDIPTVSITGVGH
jgi:hypothetical protein